MGRIIDNIEKEIQIKFNRTEYSSDNHYFLSVILFLLIFLIAFTIKKNKLDFEGFKNIAQEN